MNFLAFLLVGSFWGGSFVAIKYSIEAVPPLMAAFLRVGVGIVFLTVAYLCTGRRFSLDKRIRTRVWCVGLLAQGIPFGFLFWAEKTVSPGLAGVMNGTVPLWTFLLGFVFLPRLESHSWQRIAGITLGFVGLVAVYGPMIRVSGGMQEAAGIGALLVMAISYAAGTLMNRRLMSGERQVDLYASVYQQHLASFAFLLFLFLVSGGALPSAKAFSLPTTVGLLYLGVCSTGIAWLLFYRLIREWGAVRAASVTYIIPPIALLLDYLCFGRAPGTWEIAGTFAILAGVFLIQKQ